MLVSCILVVAAGNNPTNLDDLVNNTARGDFVTESDIFLTLATMLVSSLHMYVCMYVSRVVCIHACHMYCTCHIVCIYL